MVAVGVGIFVVARPVVEVPALKIASQGLLAGFGEVANHVFLESDLRFDEKSACGDENGSEGEQVEVFGQHSRIILSWDG